MTEKELGWLLCDGRTFDDLVEKLKFDEKDLRELRAVLDDDRLPDCQGYFLRGSEVRRQ